MLAFMHRSNNTSVAFWNLNHIFVQAHSVSEDINELQTNAFTVMYVCDKEKNKTELFRGM